MKRRKHKRRHPFTHKTPRQAPQPRTIEMEPEELAVYVRRAEEIVLPIIKELKPSPGAAQFLLAQYTPGPEYPYTLEETVQEIEEGPKAKGDYADAFQPFRPVEAVPPSGMGQVTGGIVKHPETKLWQIWMIVDGPCVYFGAYQDPAAAHRGRWRTQGSSLRHDGLSHRPSSPVWHPDLGEPLIECK